MSPLKQRIVVPVFGATSGLTVMIYGPEGKHLAMQAEIPWEVDGSGVIYWPMDWLKNILATIKTLAGKNDIIAGAMPGADLVVIGEDGCLIGPALHYRSVSQTLWKEKLAGWSLLDIYLNTGGAAVNFWQPFSQIMFDESRWALSSNEVRRIVFLADWMTAQMLGGETVFRDRTMAQSQGLFSPRAMAIYQQIFGTDISSALFSSRFCDRDYIVDNDLRKIFLMSHDSPYSRDVGFSCSPFVFWTGSWVGMAIQTDTLPSQESFKANFAFEGLGSSRAAITNTGMFGPIWKELVKLDGGDYVGASRATRSCICNGEGEVLSGFDHLSKDAKEVAIGLRDQYVSATSAMATFIKTVAFKCITDLQKAAKLLGKEEPKEVAITGGWAENEAFVLAIEQLGLKVMIPRFATEATHAGLAASALVRTGQAFSIKEALDMLPEN